MYMFAISAGLLAGEGLGGVFQALLAVAGVDGGGKLFFFSTTTIDCHLMQCWQYMAPQLVVPGSNSAVRFI